MPSAGSFRDLAAHETQCLDGRIILVLGVGSAEFARKRTRRAGRHQQRDNNNHPPLKLGAAKHVQTLIPLVKESVEEGKGSPVFSRSRPAVAILPRFWLISLIMGRVQGFPIATNGLRT